MKTWADRQSDENAMIKNLRDRLELEHNIVGHQKAGELWSLAWEYGHAYGANEVKSYYDDMVELIK